MSDYGDFCREQRQYKQDLRLKWIECPHCRIEFGTGTKVAPGTLCLRHPEWRAPGERGSDRRFAREQGAARSTQKPASRKSPCPKCGRHFVGLADHMKAKHGEAP